MFLALSKFLLEGYEEYLWLGISCFERDVLNQILYFQGLSSICLLYDGFLNTRGYIHCIITTYERCPLIQPDWPCIAGRTAIACEQHFGLGLSCFTPEIPNLEICFAGVQHNETFTLPSYWHNLMQLSSSFFAEFNNWKGKNETLNRFLFPSLSIWSFCVQLTKESTSVGHIFDVAWK